MIYINCTPHAIALNSGELFEPSEFKARVAMTHDELPSVDGIREFTANFGCVTDLPQPSVGVSYIVSSMVAAAAKDRTDLVVPATGHPETVREKGLIISVPGFIRN